MNDLDLGYIRRWISRKPLEIEAWLQWSTNRKWHMGYRMVTWPMTSRDRWRPESGCGLGHVTPIIFGILSSMSLLCGSTVGYPSDSLASCSNRNMNSITIIYAENSVKRVRVDQLWFEFLSPGNDELWWVSSHIRTQNHAVWYAVLV